NKPASDITRRQSNECSPTTKASDAFGCPFDGVVFVGGVGIGLVWRGWLRIYRCLWVYLHGLSSKDFVPALEEFFGTSAGLSASVVNRLTSAWQQEYRAFAERDLAGVDYVYVWVDGIHFKVRLDQDRVCTLVIIGARADGKKELVALSDGHRESTESWA